MKATACMLMLAVLAAAVVGAHALPRVQHPAPHFEGEAVYNREFVHVSLDDFKGKWVVLFFYPLDFTFVCPTEIITFSEAFDEFAALNAVVLGASVDSKFSHLAWLKTKRADGGLGSIRYPLISDIQKRIASDYGVLIEEGPDAGVALRGLFIIDPDQILRQVTVNDLPVGRSVHETLRLLKAFQHVDATGNVCPMNWEENSGAPELKAEPEDCLDFFQKVYGESDE